MSISRFRLTELGSGVLVIYAVIEFVFGLHCLEKFFLYFCGILGRYGLLVLNLKSGKLDFEGLKMKGIRFGCSFLGVGCTKMRAFLVVMDYFGEDHMKGMVVELLGSLVVVMGYLVQEDRRNLLVV